MHVEDLNVSPRCFFNPIIEIFFNSSGPFGQVLAILHTTLSVFGNEFWPSMNQYSMFFNQTYIFPSSSMHQNLIGNPNSLFFLIKMLIGEFLCRPPAHEILDNSGQRCGM